MSPRTRSARRAALLLILGATLVAAAPARAEDWAPVAQACASSSGVNGCAAVRAANGLWQVAVAPDGLTAYGVAYGGNALQVFDRDPATGALSQRAGSAGCFTEFTTGGCTQAYGLGEASNAVVSPDGTNVYVSSQNPGGVAIFNRAANGALTQKAGNAGCITTNGASGGVANKCGTGHGLAGTGYLAISSDGANIYLQSSSLAIFKRDGNGALTQPDGTSACFNDAATDGCAASHGIGASTSRQLALTPDGTSLYLPSQDSGGGGLVLFDRDIATGLLSEKPGTTGCITADGSGGACGTQSRLVKPLAAVASPDSRFVYVSVADGVVAFSRATSGALTYLSCVSSSGANGCTAGRNLHDMSYSAISPDQKALVVGLQDNPNPGIAVFSLDPITGALAQPAGVDGCVSSTGAALGTAGLCRTQTSLGADGQVTFVNNRQFYAGAFSTAALVAFKRDYYPHCADQSIVLQHDTLTAVPLACSDSDGDPITLAISTSPVSGTLGAIDAANARVFYSPFFGFGGSDSFRFHAVADTLTSPDATVSLTIVAPTVQPAPSPSPSKPKTVTSPISYNWRATGSKLTLNQLLVRSVPDGGTVTVACSGKHCPFKAKTFKRKASSSTLDVKKALGSKRVFKAGQTIDVRVAAAGFNTKVLRFTLKRGKVPTGSPYCIPAGKSKAQRTC
jgi:hypothetical protein